MPYIGNTIRAADDYRLIDDISSGFDGSETSFALQVAGSSLELISGSKVIMASSDILRVRTDTASAIDVTVSYLEQT